MIGWGRATTSALIVRWHCAGVGRGFADDSESLIGSGTPSLSNAPSDMTGFAACLGSTAELIVVLLLLLAFNADSGVPVVAIAFSGGETSL
jgi:hypothetical protein